MAGPFPQWKHPPLKWAGGKLQVLEHLLPLLPPAKRFVEPFVGSAVVTLNVDYPSYWINDNNAALIGFYKTIRDHEDSLVAAVTKLFTSENNTVSAYLALRAEYNSGPSPLRRAALFLYLNRFGFNGLYRVNSKGQFNVPFGRMKSLSSRETEIRALAAHLLKCTITHGDFEAVLDATGDGDVVYCDPAYVPLSGTAYFTAYTKDSFRPSDQERLARAAERARARGATVVISNHDVPVTRELYRAADVRSFEVRRNISPDAATRGEVRELLAVYEAAPAGPGLRSPTESKRTPANRSSASTPKTAE